MPRFILFFLLFMVSTLQAKVDFAEPIDSDNVQQQGAELNRIESKLKQSLSEQQLQEVLLTINQSSTRINNCIANIEGQKSELTADTDAELLRDCQNLNDQVTELRQSLYKQLNRFSFERYKSRHQSLLNATSPMAEAVPAATLITIDQLTVPVAIFFFYIVVWLLLRFLSQRFEYFSRYWLTSMILATGFTGYLLVWFFGTQTTITIEYWYGIIISSLLFFSWQHKFKWSLFFRTSFCAGYIALTHLHLIPVDHKVSVITPYYFDALNLAIWLLCFRWLLNDISRVALWSLVSIGALLLLLDAYGYHAISHQVVLSLLVVRLSWQTVQLIYTALPSLISKAYHLFGLLNWVKQSNQNLSELPGRAWVNWGISTAVFIAVFVTQLPLIGLPVYYSEQLSYAINNSFSLGTISISIDSIVSGIIIFGLLLSLSRLFQNYLEHRKSQHKDASADEAVGSIFWYAAVVTSALVALSVAGFSVQNLALVAGAFSIGIGFGLQNIVSNFVSGLILLIERPIKKGDWVVIGSTEGFVKKVSIRATEIQTFDRADIIVPNSDLITNQVTNWMLNDSVGRIKIPIGVAYGSPTDKVKEILVKIAKDHKDLIQDDAKHPIHIVFSNFGDSSLNFEIRAFLRDIANIHRVRSEINFAIDNAFRENNIEIPFPQRDLHIRSDDTRKE
ncbi:MAG: mechanosensitive ion channel [Gammaproteobacteria bacterium]|nr:mechanosensitive ion channel [Gammaproteobacteria bacterium]